MALSPGPPSHDDDSDGASDARMSAGGETMPRWVKVLGILALAVIAIVVVVHLAGGGFRGHAMQ